ncbi:MAG TPA: hypothetical protein VGS21_11610 [Acidimicrobiales bacterium]|nr:hypothetical protein [Acidimicrobiales bacterium]
MSEHDGSDGFDFEPWDTDHLARDAAERGAVLRLRRQSRRRTVMVTAMVSAVVIVAVAAIRPLAVRVHLVSPAATASTSTTSLQPLGTTTTVRGHHHVTTTTSRSGTPTTTTGQGATTTTGSPPTTTGPTGLAAVVYGTVVNQSGDPVAGASVIAPYSGEIATTGPNGAFRLACAQQPSGFPRSQLEDEVWATSWLPATVFGSLTTTGASAPADPTVGFTYLSNSGGYVSTWSSAPVCGQLKSPLTVVLPAAGSLVLSGDWPAGSQVTLYWPGAVDSGLPALWQQFPTDTPSSLIGLTSNRDDAPRSWTVTAAADGTATFPALSPDYYSVWVGNTLTTCNAVSVTAGTATSDTCNLLTPTTTTTSPSTTTTTPTTTTIP